MYKEVTRDVSSIPLLSSTKEINNNATYTELLQIKPRLSVKELMKAYKLINTLETEKLGVKPKKQLKHYSKKTTTSKRKKAN